MLQNSKERVNSKLDSEINNINIIEKLINLINKIKFVNYVYERNKIQERYFSLIKFIESNQGYRG